MPSSCTLELLAVSQLYVAGQLDTLLDMDEPGNQHVVSSCANILVGFNPLEERSIPIEVWQTRDAGRLKHSRMLRCGWRASVAGGRHVMVNPVVGPELSADPRG